MKFKWKVSNEPVGRFRSFDKRSWPSASVDGHAVAWIECEDAYEPRNVKTGNHKELTIHIAVYSLTKSDLDKHGTWRWKTLTKKAKTLDEAKELAESFCNTHQNALGYTIAWKDKDV